VDDSSADPHPPDGSQDVLSSVMGLREWLEERRPHPHAGYRLRYDETHWSYRQPISYQVSDAGGRPLAQIVPADRRTRYDSVVVGDGVIVARMRVDRRGSTSVTDAAGGDLGALRRSSGLTTFRLTLTRARHDLGVVEQRWSRVDRAEIRARDGAVAAWIGRGGRGRFAGADWSYLEFAGAAGTLPAGLLFVAVPALDAMRKQWRRDRW
jgi:hypothetical protein